MMKKMKRWSWALVVALGLLPGSFATIQAADKVDVDAVADSGKLIDINSATKEQLMTIPGIGDALADKIIAGRPYKKKTELTQKKVVPVSTYKKIAGAIIAKQ